MTGFCAGGRLFSDINGRMTGCIKRFGLGFIANRAGVGLDAGILTGRRGRDLALIPTVALGGNLSLCNEDLIAHRAVLTLGLAGLRAGRSLCCVNDFGVTLGWNLCLCNDDCVADGAVLALGLAGLRAGRLDCRVGDLGMSLGGNSRAGAYFLAAILAVGVAGVAGLGAGCFLGITKFCVLMCARRAAPDTADIVDGIAGACVRSFRVGAVGVVQLGGGNGDLMCRHTGTALRVLICRGLRAGDTLLVIDTGTGAGADVRAACGGVDTAAGGQRTVDVHLYIRQRRTPTCPSGGIDHRDELRATTAAVAAPLIHVVDVDALAAGHHQLGVLGDGGLHAGQQRCRLVDGQLAAGGQIDGHVVGQRQNILRRTDFHARQLQIQAVNLRYTVDGIVDAVGGAVIRLGQAAGDDLEHAFVPDKGNGGGVDLPQGVYRSIHRLAGAGVQGQGYLHILHGVLAKGEHLVAHIRRCRAAAEVQNLVPLVDRAAGLYGDRAAAGDEAPCVQACAGLHVDGAAGFHFDVAIRPDDAALLTAGGGIILAADADGRPVCKGEGAARRHG